MFPLTAIASLALIYNGCPPPAGADWLPLVQEYRGVQAAAAKLDRDASLDVVNAMTARAEAARAALAKVPGPTPPQLLQLLGSEQSCRDYALAFVVAKRNSEPSIADAVLGRYRADDPYAIRADTFVYLSSVLNVQQRVERVQLVRRILCSETDSSLLAIAAFHIEEFDPRDAAHMYACYLRRDTPTIRQIAYGLVKGAGPTMLALVRERLAREGDDDALRFLMEQK